MCPVDALKPFYLLINWKSRGHTSDDDEDDEGSNECSIKPIGRGFVPEGFYCKML